MFYVSQSPNFLIMGKQSGFGGAVVDYKRNSDDIKNKLNCNILFFGRIYMCIKFLTKIIYVFNYSIGSFNSSLGDIKENKNLLFHQFYRAICD